MIKVIKKQELDLWSLYGKGLPVTDMRHVVKEITIHRKAVQAIKEWRHACNMRTQRCQELYKQRRQAV